MSVALGDWRPYGLLGSGTQEVENVDRRGSVAAVDPISRGAASRPSATCSTTCSSSSGVTSRACRGGSLPDRPACRRGLDRTLCLRRQRQSRPANYLAR
jgi:hypothetical protein